MKQIFNELIRKKQTQHGCYHKLASVVKAQKLSLTETLQAHFQYSPDLMYHFLAKVLYCKILV